MEENQEVKQVELIGLPTLQLDEEIWKNVKWWKKDSKKSLI